MSKVLVIDTHKDPLDPVHPGRARLLLKGGEAAVFRAQPFTLIMKNEVEAIKASQTLATPEAHTSTAALASPESQSSPLRLKIDPGSKTTGLALVNDVTGEVVWAAELTHRGQAIRASMESRRALRRNRRARKTRHRQARFLNRRRADGWLPPSLESRVANIQTWVARLCRYAPVAAISLELVRFDTQQMQNPEIGGVAYQQGELAGYEVRQYLFAKFGRTCVYCQASGDGVRLEVEHVIPRSRGGSNRVSNLALACAACNNAKGTLTAAEFGHPEVEKRCKQPLKDAAAVNATRWALYRRLQATGLPVEVGTGGRTSYNRARLNLPKAHWIDAVCVGASTPDTLAVAGIVPLHIKAMGHGSRQMCGTDKYGFPTRHRSRARSYAGFQTGDLVRARVPGGKHQGAYNGRVTIRQRPSFRVCGIDIHPKYLTLIQKGDGYAYDQTLSPAA